MNQPVLPVACTVITWNSQHLLGTLLDSLRRQSVRFEEYLAVDNGSTDDSCHILEKSGLPWKIRRSPVNRGFAWAANRCISETSASSILLLNTDIILTSDYVEKLHATLLSHPRCGATQGLLLRAGGHMIDSAGLVFDRFRRRPLDRNAGVNLSDLPSDFPRSPFLVAGCNAAALLVRRDMCDSVEKENQVFDEGFISYFEDADLFWRARKTGWRFLCDPGARADHIRGGSAGLAQLRIYRRSWLNRFRLYLKNESLLEFLTTAPWALPLELYRLFLKPLTDERLSGTAAELLRELGEIRRLRRISRRSTAHLLTPVLGTGNLSSASADHGAQSSMIEREQTRIPLSLIVVNYNTAGLLRRCLASIRKANAEHITIVVDNNSPDDSVEMVRKEFPAVSLIPLNENRGFAVAVNSGLRCRQADTSVILNSDTELPPDFPKWCSGFFAEHPAVGIFSPLIRNDDGSIQISWGRMPTLFNEYRQRSLHLAYKRGCEQIRRHLSILYARDRMVDWVTGACLAIRHSTVMDIGMMDEGFTLYFEDIDWCVRARKAGWAVIYTPQCSITHTGGAAATTCPDEAARHYRQSQQRFYGKHCSIWQRIGLRIFFSLRGESLFSSATFRKKKAR